MRQLGFHRDIYAKPLLRADGRAQFHLFGDRLWKFGKCDAELCREFGSDEGYCSALGLCVLPVNKGPNVNSSGHGNGNAAEHNYLRLLDACEALAVAVGTSNLLDGVNMARHEAYRHLVARGFLP